jgi:hypothetical protein
MMSEKLKLLKIPFKTFMGHHATPEEWAHAVPPMGHQSQPHAPLIVRTTGGESHELEVRVDNSGNLYLALKN